MKFAARRLGLIIFQFLVKCMIIYGLCYWSDVDGLTNDQNPLVHIRIGPDWSVIQMNMNSRGSIRRFFFFRCSFIAAVCRVGPLTGQT